MTINAKYLLSDFINFVAEIILTAIPSVHEIKVIGFIYVKKTNSGRNQRRTADEWFENLAK
jgi:hypothetical protein